MINLNPLVVSYLILKSSHTKGWIHRVFIHRWVGQGGILADMNLEIGFSKMTNFDILTLRHNIRSKQVSFLLTLHRPIPPHPFFT